MHSPVFIVGTGRCGSTMMSNIVRLHPRLLSLSEFFANLAGRAFMLRNPDGESFWRLLSVPSPIAVRMMAQSGTTEEVLYPFGNGARFRPDNVPPILCAALPHLTPDYEALYDELAPVMRRAGRAPLAEHYGRLFELLAARFRRERVVERSAFSLLLVPALARTFPEARFVHLYRDGRNAALSMQRHPYFRLSTRFARAIEGLGFDPFRPALMSGSSRLFPFLEAVTGCCFPIERWLAEPLPVEWLGAYWSRMVAAGVALLGALPAGCLLNIRYEDVLARPHEELARLMTFLGPEYMDEKWLDVASALPRQPASDWRRLAADEQARLRAACGPGLALLGYL